MGGSRTWTYEYKDADRQSRRRTLGNVPDMNYVQARAMRAQEAAGLQQQPPIYPPEKKGPVILSAVKPLGSDGPTIGDLIDNALGHYLNREKSNGHKYSASYLRGLATNLQTIRDKWGTEAAAAFATIEGKRRIKEYLYRVREDHGVGAAAVMQSFMSAMFTRAERDFLIETNPMNHMERVSAKTQRVRFLDSSELALLWPATMTDERGGYPSGYLVRLALLTGRRVNELCRAEWSEFNLETGVWTLPGDRAKNDTTHALPLSPSALALLRDAWERRHGDGRYVFHRDGEDAPLSDTGAYFKKFIRALNEATKDATERRAAPEQRTPWSMHVLRHTVETLLQDTLGCPYEYRNAILNHSSTALGEGRTYSHGDLMNQKREWLNKLDQYINSLVPLALPAPARALPAA